MITKRTLAEQIYLLLADSTDDSRYDIREVIPVVESAAASILKAEYEAALLRGEYLVAAEFVYPYEDVVVQLVDSQRRSYAELPAIPLRLRYDRGVFSVSAMDESLCPFIPIGANDFVLLKDTPSGFFEGQQAYYREGNRLYFLPCLKEGTRLLVKLFLPISALDEEEDIAMPPDTANAIIAAAYNLLRTKAPQENVNDNSDKL